MTQTKIFKAGEMGPQEVAAVAADLAGGAVAVFPTDTVYGIGCSAFCETSVRQIYTLKKRPFSQPLQILIEDVAMAQQVGVFSAGAVRLAKMYWPGALTLIVPPVPSARAWTCGAKGLGIRVPSYPLLVQILHALKGPLCSTSANLHGQAVLTDETKLEKTFDSKTDIIIKGGTLSPVASSVVDLTDPAHPRLLRQGAITREQLEHCLGQILE